MTEPANPILRAVEVFFSYSHRDEALRDELAKHLRLLERQGVIAGWHDRRILPGTEWAGEIDIHLQTASVILLLVSADFLNSDYCYDIEMQRAMERHDAGEARVIPIILRAADWTRAPFGKLQALPKDGYPVTSWDNQDEAFTDVARGIREVAERLFFSHSASPGGVPATPLGKLINVPSLPAHFLPRPEDLARLKSLVLTKRQRPVAVTGASRRVGLQGMGGIGKTVLAAALARDDDVRAAFPDGVFWLTLGQDPAVIERQAQLAHALGGEFVSFTDTQQGQSYLSERLADTACFIILDDVWQSSHLRGFDVLGPRCRLLITTRDFGVITSLGACEHRLEVMSQSQAMDLLAKWADQSTSALPSEARLIAQECGYLPLALAMIGSMVRGKPERWENALYQFHQADLHKIRQDFPDYPYPDMFRVIQVSVEALKPDVQVRYLDFAVFPEDTPIPEAALQTYWESEGLTQYDVQNVVDTLVNHSLLRRDDKNCVTMHDLQFDYVRAQAVDLSRLHKRLLSAYTVRCPDGWCTILDDGYLYAHLAYHLLAVDRKKELCALLTSSPEWMETKFVALNGDVSYAADLDLAINACCDTQTTSQLLTLSQLMAARQMVNERVGIYTDTDLTTLVFLGRDSIAVNHARLRSNPGNQCRGLLTIYNTQRAQDRAEDKLLVEALEAAKSIKESASQSRFSSVRTNVLRDLAEALVQAGHMALALEAVQAIEEDNERALARSYIAKLLAHAGHLEKALEVARSISGGYPQRFALLSVAEALTQVGSVAEASGVYTEVLTAAGAEEIEYNRHQALEHVATSMAQMDHLERALEVARSIASDYSRVSTLSKIANFFMQAGRSDETVQILYEALEIAKSIKHDAEPNYALRNVGKSLARNGHLSQGLEILNSLKDNSSRNYELKEVAQVLAQNGQLEQALEAIKLIEDDSSRNSALQHVAQTLVQNRHPEKALEILTLIEDDFGKNYALKNVARGLFHIKPWRQDNYIKGLSELILYLAQSRGLKQSLEMLGFIKDKINRLFSLNYFTHGQLNKVVTSLAQDGYLDQALEMARFIEDTSNRIYALRDVAAALFQANQADEANQIFAEALEAADSIEDTSNRANALRGVAANLARLGRVDEASRVLAKALEIARYIENASSRDDVLGHMAVVLAQAGYLEHALEVAKSIEHVQCVEDTTTTIASSLRHIGYLGYAHNTAWGPRPASDHTDKRTDTLKAVAKIQAQTGHLELALEAVQFIHGGSKRGFVLSSVTEALVEIGNIKQAIDVAWSIKDGRCRATALIRVAKSLMQNRIAEEAVRLLDEALETARAMEDDASRNTVLREVAKALAHTGDVEQALRILAAMEDDFKRNYALQDVARALTQAGYLSEALEVTRSIAGDGLSHYELAQ